MDDAPSYASNSLDMQQRVDAKVESGKPTFFRLEAKLPSQGRGDVPIASSEHMWVVLKLYANGGENTLHAHPHEDHTFVALQGRAIFYGPNGEEKIIGAYEGVLLPRGTFYMFHVISEEPLVMVRIGAASGEGDRFARIHLDGTPMVAGQPTKPEPPMILSDRWFGRV